MQAMLFDRPGQPLRLAELPVPAPGPSQILIKVAACGVCRTDLHIVDGELPLVHSPLILGHEIAGVVAAKGASAHRFAIGDRVGVPWLAGSCGSCRYCIEGRENLCEKAIFTGYHRRRRIRAICGRRPAYCFALPERYDDLTRRRCCAPD